MSLYRLELVKRIVIETGYRFKSKVLMYIFLQLRRVDVPFDSFGRIRHQKFAELGQNAPKQRVFETWARTLKRVVKETWLSVQMKGIDVQF